MDWAYGCDCGGESALVFVVKEACLRMRFEATSQFVAKRIIQSPCLDLSTCPYGILHTVP